MARFIDNCAKEWEIKKMKKTDPGWLNAVAKGFKNLISSVSYYYCW